MKSKDLISALALVATGSVLASTRAAARNQDEIHAQTLVTRSSQVEIDRVIDAISAAIYIADMASTGFEYLVRLRLPRGWVGMPSRSVLVWLMARGNP
jgi:hypothetical protein